LDRVVGVVPATQLTEADSVDRPAVPLVELGGVRLGRADLRCCGCRSDCAHGNVGVGSGLATVTLGTVTDGVVTLGTVTPGTVATGVVRVGVVTGGVVTVVTVSGGVVACGEAFGAVAGRDEPARPSMGDCLTGAFATGRAAVESTVVCSGTLFGRGLATAACAPVRRAVFE
jgi:hypothetical protein